MYSTKRGFTLIELLVVVAIIGILATVVVVNISSAQNKARDSKVKSDLSTVQTAANLYFNDSGTYATLSCSPAGGITCDSLASNNDVNIKTIGNAAKDISSTLNNTDGLTILTLNSTYQISAKLPSAQSSSNPQAFVFSNSANGGGSGAQINSVNAGLTGWWKFDESSGSTAADSSIMNSPGSFAAGTPAAAFATGKYSNAVNFSGTGAAGYVDINQAMGFNKDFTISFWSKSTEASNWRWFLNVNGYGSAADGGIQLATNSGSPRWSYGPFFVTEAAGGLASTMYPANDTAWHLMTYTRSGTTLSLYINGVAKGTSTTTTTNNINTTAQIKVGRGPTDAYTLNGMIDDLRIYNRALTQTEISYLAQN